MEINRKIISIFDEMAKIYNIFGDEFRAMAYIKVVRSIKKFNKKIDYNNLSEIEGVGKKIAIKIKEILDTGDLAELKELKKNPFISRIEFLSKIKGFSVKTIKELIKNHDVSTLDDIRNLVKRKKIKINSKQELGLKYAEDLMERIPRKEVELIGNLIIKEIKKINPKISALIVGSYRRKKETSGDVDILLVSNKQNGIINDITDVLKEKKMILGIFAKGKTKFSGIIKTQYSSVARQLDILLVPHEDYYTALLHFTGSGLFNRRMRLIAIEKGYKLSEKGLIKGGKKIKSIKSEKDIFKLLGVKYLKPEDRDF